MDHAQFSGLIVRLLRFSLMTEDFVRATQRQIERGEELTNPIVLIGSIGTIGPISMIGLGAL